MIVLGLTLRVRGRWEQPVRYEQSLTKRLESASAENATEEPILLLSLLKYLFEASVLFP